MTKISSSGGDKLTLYHKPNSDLSINKSDLIIYLSHFKQAVEEKRSRTFYFILSVLAKVSFIWSIFFTSDFKSFGMFSGEKIKTIYVIFAAILSILELQKLTNKDGSKYKIIDPEKMVEIIEDNCIKLKK